MSARVISRNTLFVTALLATIAAGVAALLACGPFLTDLVTVTTIDPADAQRFAKGDLGVVRPHFRRRNLLQAYRVLSGQPPLRENDGTTITVPARAAAEDWFQIAHGRPPGFLQYRYTANYQSVLNCHDDAFDNAVRTYRDREQRFGAGSAEVRNWLEGQKAVFSNCAEQTLTLPADAPVGIDKLIHADRAYQTAAAYFYARDYDEAERRFRAIALDSQSPWRIYGHFLAARSIIRRVTTNSVALPGAGLAKWWPDEDVAQLKTAERELERVLDDRDAAPLYASARRLRAFLACRTRPLARLHELTAKLTRDPTVESQDLNDYVWLMDHLVGDTVAFHVSDEERVAIAASDDFTSWVLLMQDTAPNLDSALAAWRAGRSPAWLVALLWRVKADHPAAAELLQAAGSLDPQSPAYATALFLRVRVLTEQGRFDDARAVLAAVPASATASRETHNLYRAQGLRLSRSLDEFLLNAPREYVVDVRETWRGQPLSPQPVFDEDAAGIFTSRMPLYTLVAASESTRLPERLRARVASTAFVRSVVLKDDVLGRRAAVALGRLAESVAADLHRYAEAPTSEARHRAALLVLVRTPGLHMDVKGLDDDHTIAVREPHRQFDHMFRQNWWCGPDQSGGAGYHPTSELVHIVYDDQTHRSNLPFPAFITDEERRQVETERRALTAVGSGRAYLATEVLAWAQNDSRNPEVAEALAHVVEGWRWGCGDFGGWPLVQRAFQTLHRNFPQSDWAKRTKYWYRG